MTVFRRPLLKTDEFLPGLEEQHEVGLSGVGVHVVTATLACNTVQTAAELMASPPNTDTTPAATGPVVHSLGATPTAAFAQPVGNAHLAGLFADVSYRLCTCDNSAVYFWPTVWSGVVRGVQTQITVIR